MDQYSRQETDSIERDPENGEEDTASNTQPPPCSSHPRDWRFGQSPIPRPSPRHGATVSLAGGEAAALRLQMGPGTAVLPLLHSKRAWQTSLATVQ